MNVKYYRCDEGDFVSTDKRPTAEESARLQREFERHLEQGVVHQHAPGEGWHFLPGVEIIAFNGKSWFATRPTSPKSILAHVMDICTAAGVDFEALWRAAYPESEVPQVTDEDWEHCTRHATLQDLPAVLSDLEDVNFHALHKVLKGTIHQRGTEQLTAGRTVERQGNGKQARG